MSQQRTDEEIENEFKKKLALQHTEERRSKGGFYYSPDDEITKLQRRVIWDVVKNLGNSLLEGKDLVNTTLPVYIFEKRSFLERMTDNWGCIHMLSEAKGKSPLLKFLTTIAFAIGGLVNTTNPMKPFNPILGETFQGYYPTGEKVFMEQTSHHPPVSHWYVIGDGFKFYGYGAYNASIRGNALKGVCQGPNTVHFDDDTIIEYTLPYLWLRGIVWGQRVLDYCGEMPFECKKHDLKCTLVFDPYAKGFFKSLFSKQTSPTDTVKGDVLYKGEVIGTIEGSWLDSLSYTDRKSVV